MKLYVMEYKKQYFLEDKWVDTCDARYTLLTVAETQEEASAQFNKAIEKLNKHAGYTYRYLTNSDPREVEAVSICEDIRRTTITGIWE